MRSMHLQCCSKPIFKCLFFSLIFVAIQPLFISAESTDQKTNSNSASVYDQSYFENYNPVTLSDMIRVVPGGLTLLSNLNQNQQSRGLGSNGEQILIDGKRMSGKSNDISTRLNRIQASQVERIELIRTTAEGMDVRSEGTILNVILKDKTGSDYYVEVIAQHNNVMGAIPEALITKNGSLDNLDYTVSYHYDTWLRFSEEIEDRQEFDPINRELRILVQEFDVKRHTFTANTKYNLPEGDVIQFNAFFRDMKRYSDKFEDQFDATTDLLLASEAQINDYDETRWEFGADYETDIDGLGNLKTLLILSRTANTRDITQDEFVAGDTERLFTFVEDAVQTERIARLNISRNVFGEDTIEYGAEAAFNQLVAEQSFDFADFENSDVAEDRYELFFTYSFHLTEQLILQLAMNRESSSIEQDSLGVLNTRDFEFWKPRMELRYDFDEQNQFRLLLEKSVSQLNLRNFVAKRNTEDDTIDLGNPFLIPEIKKQVLLGYEHRFASDTGSINLEFFRDEYEDHISQAPLIDGGTGIGNIGDASTDGINVETNMKLDSLGLDDALISFSYEYRDTEANDPFLDQARPLNGIPMHSYFLDFRHDLTEHGIVYGLSAHKRTAIYRSNITLYEVRTNTIHLSDVFLEYTLGDGMRLRAEVRNPLNDKKFFDKTFYVDNIADQIIDRTEYRKTAVRPTLAVKFQISF